MKSYWFFWGLVVIGCTQQAIDRPGTVTAMATKPPAPAGERVGELKQFESRVTFRRSRQLVWEEVTPLLPFYRFDALQTHEQARASVELVNHSSIEMEENTLIILNPDNAAFAGTDRLIMRNGALDGKTKSNLWLLTSAALVKLRRQNPKDPPAAIRVVVREGKNAEIKLLEGQATVLTEVAVRGSKATEMKKGESAVIAAPVPPQSFGIDETPWNRFLVARTVAQKDPAPPKRAPSRSPSAAAKGKPPVPPAEIVLSSPVDLQEVTTASVALKGTVTGDGGLVRVNNEVIPVAANGEFSKEVSVAKGANTIIVQLQRKDGKTLFYRRTVIRRN